MGGLRTQRQKEQNTEEYAARILCQMSRQAIVKQKDLECLECREETGPFEGNWDPENLVKYQRGMVAEHDVVFQDVTQSACYKSYELNLLKRVLFSTLCDNRGGIPLLCH